MHPIFDGLQSHPCTSVPGSQSHRALPLLRQSFRVPSSGLLPKLLLPGDGLQRHHVCRLGFWVNMGSAKWWKLEGCGCVSFLKDMTCLWMGLFVDVYLIVLVGRLVAWLGWFIWSHSMLNNRMNHSTHKLILAEEYKLDPSWIYDNNFRKRSACPLWKKTNERKVP